jgi:hypothetical protein
MIVYTGPRARAAVTATLLGLLVLAIGCKSGPQTSAMMKQSPNVQVSQQQVRLATHVFVGRFSGVVENAADEIIAATDDPAVRRNAILWKISAVSVGQRAAFQEDPLAGYLDLWILCEQMEQFFMEDSGKDLFGEHQQIAVRASRQIADEAESLAKGMVVDGDVSYARRTIDEWVDENPLDNILFDRISTRLLVADVMKQQGKGAFAAIGSLDETVSDVVDRSTFYAEYLPKMAFWEVELLLDEVIERNDIQRVIVNSDELAEALTRIADAADALYAMADQGLIELLPEQRQILTDFIEDLQKLVFADIAAERALVLETVSREREIVLEVLERERIAVLAAVHQERLETMDQIDGILKQNLNESWAQVDSLLNRLFWRILVLVAILGAVVLILGFAALRALKS